MENPSITTQIETGRLTETDLAELRRAASTVRTLSMDAIQKANSGHPGMPMGMADAAVVLWTRHLRHNPRNPQWADRDRFVLSAGHGSMLLYSLLHLTGYDLSLSQLQAFRQWDSQTPGHPERGLTPGVETTTGPLGQGLSNAVGMAMGERWLATRYNRPGFAIVNHFTYVIASDGDLMEGVSHESCGLAGHLRLGKLIVLYDDNQISIDGSTDLTFSERVLRRFEAYDWHVQEVDGHDLKAVHEALLAARAEASRPSIIACRTIIGYASPNRAGTAKAHGEPLGVDEVRLSKQNLNWPEDAQFLIPEDVSKSMRSVQVRGTAAQAEWDGTLAEYAKAHPDLLAEFERVMKTELPAGWDKDLPIFPLDKPLATRAASGAALNALSPRIPHLMGGSADLTGSNNTLPREEKPLTANDFSGRYIHFGVREHGMGAILNGLALHGGIRPYGGTFLVFSDYMRPSIRLAALMEQPVIYVFTHDSIGLGEDGPTHQPIEHLMSLRAIPNLVVIRPADANETVEAWRVALQRKDGPTALVLSRQKMPVLHRQRKARGVVDGAYIVAGNSQPEVILMGTGSEVHVALEARKLLERKQVRAQVVSMPSYELFAAQSAQYKEEVFPEQVRARVAVEAGATLGWYRYVGDYGEIIGLDRFGASAPYQDIYKGLGITAESVAEAAVRSMHRAKNRS